MRNKVREILCRDQAGKEVIVIEWSIQPTGTQSKSACCEEFSLVDGSPVSPLGGRFEHFYSGKLFTPV